MKDYTLPNTLPNLGSAQLLQVCFGINEVILNFTDAITLTIESEYSVNGMPNPIEALVLMLGKTIAFISCLNYDTLQLQLGEQTLLVFNKNENFESYTLNYEGTFIVV